MSTQTSNPLDFIVNVVTGIGVGTVGSKIVGDFTQPYYAEDFLAANVESRKETSSAVHAHAGLAQGMARKEVYQSDLLSRVTSVAGRGVGLPVEGLIVFGRVNRSWAGAMLLDVTGRSRHAFSEADMVWVGGGRATFNGGADETLSTPHDVDHAVAQPRIEVKARMPFVGSAVLADKGTYILALVGDQLSYTYESGLPVNYLSESLQQYGYRPRQDLVFAVEHLVMPDDDDTRIRFLVSADGSSFNIIGQDEFVGSEVEVDGSTDPLVVGPADGGEIFWVKIKEADSGVLVATADLTDVPAGASAWGSVTGESWIVNHGSLAAEPSVVGTEVDDWGLNLKGDIVSAPSSLVMSAGTLMVAVHAAQHPAADTVLLASQSLPNQFSITHTAAGKFRVRLGEQIYESTVVLGDNVIAVAFALGQADVRVNDEPMTQIGFGNLPTEFEILPSRTGVGSADDEDYLFLGLAALDHMASDAERELYASALTN